MPRRTKIVATLGPATDNPVVMDELIQAGLDVVRINLSHDTPEAHRKRIEMVRERAKLAGREIGILADLQGPKIRIGRFAEDKVELDIGANFCLDGNCDLIAGDRTRVGITYQDLARDVNRGDTLLLDDGAIQLWVDEVKGRQVCCRVVVGGTLSNNKGINKQGGGLSAPALTEKDCTDIIFAASLQVDYLAVSFVLSSSDVRDARKLLRDAGGTGGICAKIERTEALNQIESIIEAADAIMIARGDLGVEIGDAKLPAEQKRLIKTARRLNSVVITATQMMQSMINSPIPTRAEVLDVANAVIDGTDAVMLSAETSVGNYPVKTVEAMHRVCVEAERQTETRTSNHRMDSVFGRVDEAIAMAAMYTANHLQVKAIASLTETGSTVKWMSRISSAIPIYALTPSTTTCTKVTLFRGVYPVYFDLASISYHEVNTGVIKELLRNGAVRTGDLVIITKGDRAGVEGQTNTMKIVRVDERFLVTNNQD